jgi:hypothetical protein
LHSQGFFLQHWPDWSVACFDREPCAAHNTVRDATLIATNPTSPNAITRNDFPELLAMCFSRIVAGCSFNGGIPKELGSLLKMSFLLVASSNLLQLLF